MKNVTVKVKETFSNVSKYHSGAYLRRKCGGDPPPIVSVLCLNVYPNIHTEQKRRSVKIGKHSLRSLMEIFRNTEHIDISIQKK